MNNEQIAQARVLARLLPTVEQREVVEALLDEIEQLRVERDRLQKRINYCGALCSQGVSVEIIRQTLADALEDKR